MILLAENLIALLKKKKYIKQYISIINWQYFWKSHFQKFVPTYGIDNNHVSILRGK